MRSHSSGLPQRIQTSLKSNDYVNVFTGQHTSTERISLTKECGWKDGDRGGLAEWEQTHGKKKAKCALTSTGLLMEGLGLACVLGSIQTPRDCLYTAPQWTVQASTRKSNLLFAHCC